MWWYISKTTMVLFLDLSYGPGIVSGYISGQRAARGSLGAGQSMGLWSEKGFLFTVISSWRNYSLNLPVICKMDKDFVRVNIRQCG